VGPAERDSVNLAGSLHRTCALAVLWIL